ncbi:ribonuclease H [Senna tora]|uniref:Ribonuclease H n=1 Tax=Senna tora TaxID=362788 RepID=A0A834XFT8_9FABA|nr:ribonuclease H [Senna tora]
MGRYLGANNIHGRKTKQKFAHVIERIQSKLSGWKAGCLSLAGRATLIQSVISTIPLYHMPHGFLPKGIIQQIEKLERAFLWGSTQDQRRQHQVSWDKLLCNKDKLWITLVKDKYDFNRSNMDSMHYKNSDSRFWKDLVRVLPLEIVEKIVNRKPLDPRLSHDVPNWLPGKNGAFSIKSAYHAIKNVKLGGEKSIWDMIWKVTTQQRDKFFLWRLAHNSLPTRSKIAGWNNISPMCPLCSSSRETNIHIVRDCHKASTIRKYFINPRDKACFFFLPIKEWIKWNLSKKSNFGGMPWPMIFSIVCNQIWKWRNKCMKDVNFVFPSDPHSFILRTAKSYALAWCVEKTGGTLVSKAEEFWEKPEPGWVKFNTDGAVSLSNQIAGCGGIFRDDTGAWMCGYLENLGTLNPLGAELWGMLTVLTIAWEMGLKKVVVECDSSLALKLVTCRHQLESPCTPVIDCIRKIL